MQGLHASCDFCQIVTLMLLCLEFALKSIVLLREHLLLLSDLLYFLAHLLQLFHRKRFLFLLPQNLLNFISDLLLNNLQLSIFVPQLLLQIGDLRSELTSLSC